MKKYFLFIFLIFPLTICAEIVQINSISKLMDYISDHGESKPLVIYDIDNTILEPKNPECGSVQWFKVRSRQKRKEGCSGIEAFKFVLQNEYYQSLEGAQYSLVEREITSDVLARLTSLDIKTLALTSRAEESINFTEDQFKSNNVFPNLNLNLGKEIFCLLENNERYKRDAELFKLRCVFCSGVIYCGYNYKGLCLDTFLNKLEEEDTFLFNEIKSGGVIFIDDERRHLEAVEIVLKEKNIKFTGLEYLAVKDKYEEYVAKGDGQE